MTAPDDWDDGAALAPGGHVMQSTAWARIREAQGWRAEYLREGGAHALVLWRGSPFGPIGYVPRGPVARDDDVLAPMLARLAALARERGAVFLKVDPEIDAARAGAYAAAGYRRSEDIQPVLATFEIDLAASEEELLAGLDKDTRWSVRTAPRRGVTVRTAHREPDLRAFYGLYAETGRRAGFITREWRYYERVWRTLVDAGLATLRLAEVEGRAHAGAMTWRCGDRELYMHGATGAEGRTSLAAYSLQWECIVAAKRAGRRRYDLGGVPVSEGDTRDPMHGPYLFKKGFGGTRRAFAGAHDTVPRPLAYAAYRVAQPLYTRALRLRGALR
ncbi:MAG: peptidoglycan bridge formation glycyltransferase FemA/FemB family protein [Chloroflexi bacterium]|nr:peptidoglycan bridge formation glycyltransferase FemA/FemB family protein [Chloroflexota bacterium]